MNNQKQKPVKKSKNPFNVSKCRSWDYSMPVVNRDTVFSTITESIGPNIVYNNILNVIADFLVTPFRSNIRHEHFPPHGRQLLPDFFPFFHGSIEFISIMTKCTFYIDTKSKSKEIHSGILAYAALKIICSIPNINIEIAWILHEYLSETGKILINVECTLENDYETWQHAVQYLDESALKNPTRKIYGCLELI